MCFPAKGLNLQLGQNEKNNVEIVNDVRSDAARCFCFQEASLEHDQNSLGHVLALQIVEVAPRNGQESSLLPTWETF